MPNTPIKGYEGTVAVNGLSTAWINSWEVQLEAEEQDIGPFHQSGNV